MNIKIFETLIFIFSNETSNEFLILIFYYKKKTLEMISEYEHFLVVIFTYLSISFKRLVINFTTDEIKSVLIIFNDEWDLSE